MRHALIILIGYPILLIAAALVFFIVYPITIALRFTIACLKLALKFKR